MRFDRTMLGRRELLALSVASLGLLAPSLSGAAETATFSLDPLHSPALMLSNPGTALMVAITRAGKRLVSVGAYGVIIYSDDNGLSWRQARVPVNVTLTCVGFGSAGQGWAAGHSGVILSTADGGENWEVQLDGNQANHLALIAAQQAVAQNSAAPAVAHSLRRANIFAQQGSAIPFLSLLVMTDQKIMAFGAYRMTVATADSGSHWVDASLRIDDAFSHNLYAASSRGGLIYVAGEAGLVFCSSDGGASFPQVATPAEITWFGILTADDGSLTVFGVQGNAYRSADGGKSWLPTAIETQDNLTCGRRIASGHLLIATESGSVFVSKDNGATFLAVDGVPPMGIYDLEEADDNTVVLVGNSGTARLSSTHL